MQTIRFSGRTPSPSSIEIGMETDSNSETLRFLLPQIDDGQIATLQMILPDGTADVLQINDGQAVIPARIMEIPGTARAWVEILGTGTVAWHSEMIYMGIGDTPDISERTEQQYPTALQEAVSRSETAQATAEAAAAYAAASSGQATFTLNSAGHLVVTWTDTDGQSHDTDIGEVSAYAVAVKNGYTGTEAQWEQYIATASINAASAAADALKAEGYAVGKQAGTDVSSGSEYYHNNAKYYNTQAQSAKTAAQEAASTAAAAYGTDLLAEDYDTETGATAGKYYIHSGDLYLCTADATGAWDSTKFKKVTVGGQLGELKSALGDITGNDVIQWQDGKAIMTNVSTINYASPLSVPAFRCAVVDCAEGDKFTVNGTAGSSTARIWAFCDDAGTRKSVAASGDTSDNLILTAPAGATKLILNDNVKTGSAYKGIGLSNRVDTIESAIGFDSETKEFVLNTSQAYYKPYAIDYETSQWVDSGNPHSYQLDNVDGNISIVTVYGRASGTPAYIYLLKSIDVSQNPDFVDPQTPYISVAAGTTQTIEIPPACKYILILARRSTATSFTPQKVEYTESTTIISTHSAQIAELGQEVTGLSQAVTELDQDVDGINNYHYGTSWENNYNIDHLLELPSKLTDVSNPFPIPISISKMGNVYGHNINIRDDVKNSANKATYYVSPTGDDTNTGLDSNAPLLSITAALNKSDVNTIILLPGVYLKGTHFTADAITKTVNIIGVGKVTLKTTSGNGIKFSGSCYVENVIFYGGDYACECTLATEVIAFNRCVFTHGNPYGGVLVNSGGVIFWECIAEHNNRDGFGYTRKDGYSAQAIEIKCKASFNGENNYDDHSCNGSTGHNAYTRIIRIGCEYFACRGPVCADTNSCFSLNIRVSAFSDQELAVEDRVSNFFANHATEMWLYDCDSFGSLCDIMAQGSGSVIYTNKTYANEATLSDGAISRI